MNNTPPKQQTPHPQKFSPPPLPPLPKHVHKMGGTKWGTPPPQTVTPPKTLKRIPPPPPEQTHIPKHILRNRHKKPFDPNPTTTPRSGIKTGRPPYKPLYAVPNRPRTEPKKWVPQLINPEPGHIHPQKTIIDTTGYQPIYVKTRTPANQTPPPINITTWDQSPEKVPHGLGGEADLTYTKPQYDKAINLTDKDITIMKFLARYRYAYPEQVARLTDNTLTHALTRLNKLEQYGFIRRESITPTHDIYLTRKAGNLIIDIDFPEIKKGSISYTTIAHTIGLGNLGVELEKENGGKNILGEAGGDPNWVPPQNRYRPGHEGDPNYAIIGERTVTEREIRQSQIKWRGRKTSTQMRDFIETASNNPDGPEYEEGNEGLYMLYGGHDGSGGEHVPDLIVVRPRKVGTQQPQHIAIELELTPKQPGAWTKILRNYHHNGHMFSKIIYYTHRKSLANNLQHVIEKENMQNRVFVKKYVPTNTRTPFWG